MIVRLMAAGLLAAFWATAQTYATPAWFPDGTGVELHIETTGSTTQIQLTGGGVIWIDQGIAHVYRSVQDSHGKTVFGYELEAYKAREPSAIAIRITRGAGDPTVSDVREFPAVKYGQEVKIEILTNPATGERVYDVLRPIEGRSPAPGQHAIGGVTIPKLVVNGETVAVKSDWGGDQSPRLYIPGHGAYYMSWESRPKFRLAGYIEKNRLIFLMDRQYVEMAFPSNVLTKAEGGPVWIYHDPNFVQGGATCLLESYHSF